MKVDTLRVDGDTLSTTKEVEVEAKQFKTPAKALQVGKLRASEEVTPLARGIAETYKKVTAVALENSRAGWSGLAKSLESQEKNAQDGEVVVTFIEYEDTEGLSPENAREIAKLQANYGNILTVPLQTELVDAADDGDARDSLHVSKLIENAEVFLDAVNELGIDKPTMGVVPPVSDDCTEALVELYAERGLRAYCANYNRRSPMAQSQIDNVSLPLMQMLEAYDIREESLLYAVNANPSRKAADDRRTPDAVYAYTLGYDIVGDNHIAPKFPEEVFEGIKKQNEEGEVEMRLFDAESVSIEEVAVSELEFFLPDEAEVPVHRVKNRVAKNPDEKYRFRKLINAELISIHLKSEGGVAPEEVFRNLALSNYSQDTDLERVQNLADEVGS